MPQPLKDAISVCKTIMRNGYEAYIVNVPLHERALRQEELEEVDIDICTDMEPKEMEKIFPNLSPPLAKSSFACLKEGEVTFHFYPADTIEASYTEASVAKLTPRLLKEMEAKGELPFYLACPYIPRSRDVFEGFEDLDTGVIALKGIPDENLKRDYLKAIKPYALLPIITCPLRIIPGWLLCVQPGELLIMSLSQILWMNGVK